MDKLRAMQLYTRLAELGSFTAVAEELGQSKSMVSKEISRLEDSLGARLLQRSTRTLRLTQIGEGYLQHCRDILLKLEDAETFVQDLQDRPRGTLKINAPMALGLIDLSTLFAEFMEQYPEIELDIHLGDEPVDLLQQGFDLGFRVTAKLDDSQYIGKALTQFTYRVCTSKAYLKKHGPIKQASDLEKHNCFTYHYFRGKNHWPLDSIVGEGVPVKGQLKVNSTIFMLEAIKRGLGIGFMPDFVCDSEIENGNLVEILTHTQKPKPTLYAMYPAREYLPPKLRVCIDFMDKWFQQNQIRP